MWLSFRFSRRDDYRVNGPKPKYEVGTCPWQPGCRLASNGGTRYMVTLPARSSDVVVLSDVERRIPEKK
jgi:hypothetical protein